MNRLNWALIAALPTSALVASAYATDYLTVQEAQKILFFSNETFESVSVQLSDEQRSIIKAKSGIRQRVKNPLVWKVLKKGNTVGWFILDEVIGKHEFITFGLGISVEGNVIGVEILSYSETHGGQVREATWRKKFIGKNLTDPFKLDVDVPNISGATLSCRNVLDGVKRLLILREVVLNDKTT